MDLSVTNYTYKLPISRMDIISLNPTIFAITGAGFSMARDIYINGSAVVIDSLRQKFISEKKI